MHRQHGRVVSLTEQISIGHDRLTTPRQGVLQLSDEARGGEASQVLEQLVLEPPVTDGGMRLGPALVIPVAAGGARLGILASGKPLLGEVPEPQIVGRTGSAHLGGHPARVHRRPMSAVSRYGAATLTGRTCGPV
jgi:hypothetical protein